MFMIICIILLILGAKSTWKLVQSFIPTSVDDELGFYLAIFIFVVTFLIVGPIMGIVTSGKYLIIYFSSRASKTEEKTIK